MSRELIAAQMAERGELFAAIKNLLDLQDTRDLTTEEKNKLTELFEKADKLKDDAENENRKLEQRKRLEQYENSLSGGERPKLLLSTPAGTTAGEHFTEQQKEEQKIARQRQGIRLLFQGSISNKEAIEKYDLRSDVMVQGGYLVSPQFFLNELLKDIRDRLVLRQICRVLPKLPKPGELAQNTISKIGRPTRPTSEKQRASSDSTLVFGQRKMYTHSMDLSIAVTRDFMNFADWPVEAEIRALMGESFADEMEIEYATGDGVKKGLGMFVANADGISSARDFTTGHTSGTAVHPDNLLILPDKLPEGLLVSGQVGFLMHRAVKTAFRLIKANSAGTYLWQPSLQVGVPDTFNGYPVYTSDKCPSTISSGNYVAIFGNFQEYLILDAAEQEWFINPYSKANTREIEIDARIYTDSQPRRGEAFARSKMP